MDREMTKWEQHSGATWRAVAGAAALVMAACGSASESSRHPTSVHRNPVPTIVSQPSQTLPPQTLPNLIENQNINAPSAAERQVQPGEVIAKMHIPKMCGVWIDIVAMDKAQADEAGSGSSPIDATTPEATPQPDCAEAVAHAKQMRALPEGRIKDGYATRGERTNGNYPDYIDKNNNHRQDPGEEYSHRANAFVPIAGYYMGTAPISNTNGNTFIFGHRTTRSAPFAVMDMLKTDDEIEIITTGPKPHDYKYNVTKVEVVDAADEKAIDQAQFPVEAATQPMLTLAGCNPQRSNAQRFIVRAKLTSES